MLILTGVVLNGKVTVFFLSVWRLNSKIVQGFTAIVDKQLSAKYETLVNNAPELIKVLPWGKDFEVDVFRKPDFTALEVVSFATGGTCNSARFYSPYTSVHEGIPAGINVSVPCLGENQVSRLITHC